MSIGVSYSLSISFVIFAAALWHMLYDWHWQGDFIAKNKGKSWVIMMVHCLTWTMGLCMIIGLFVGLNWWTPIQLFVGHWLMDKWKCDKVEEYEEALKERLAKLEPELSWAVDEKQKMRYYHKLIFADQFVHALQIMVAILL